MTRVQNVVQSSRQGAVRLQWRDGDDLPTLTVEAVRAQAYLKTPKQMWRAFGQISGPARHDGDRRALHLPADAGEVPLEAAGSELASAAHV